MSVCSYNRYFQNQYILKKKYFQNTLFETTTLLKKTRDSKGKNDYVILAGKSHYVESEMLGQTGKTDHVSYVITFAVPLCYDLLGKTDYVRT